ncbi:hypothetical protein C0993_001903 [Termitomyces sp. T159_Od127]|nr:hypothetical protein C0993_001903 [Termitomyces sp. T159_Od127]
MPATPKAPAGGAKGLASPTKKLSPTKPASKRRGCKAPRYEAPTQLDFTDKELARLLVLKQVQVVVDTEVEAWVVLKETKSKQCARGKTVAISKRSLALLTRQGKEGREGSKGKCKASPPLSPMDKGKKRVRVVSPAVVTPKVKSEKEEDEACCLAAAIEASKVVLGGDALAGPSCQLEAPQDVGAQQAGSRDKVEKEGKAEATHQAQP